MAGYLPAQTGATNSPQICITLRGNNTDGKFQQAHISNLVPDGVDMSQPEIVAAAWTCNAQGVPVCNFRAILKFDLSEIPQNVTITSARLTLYAKTNNLNGNPGSPTFGTANEGILQKVTTAWSASSVSWNNQPQTTTTGQVNLQQSTSTVQDYELNVVNMVKDWVKNPSSNHGAMLRLKTENYYNSLIFNSGTAAQNVQPKLEICYIRHKSGSPAGSDTTCKEGLPLFAKEYKAAGDQFIYSAVSFPDGSSISAGYTGTGGSGGSDGLLVKADRKGTIVWSKAIGGTGDDLFYQIRATTDGGIIAGGHTKSFGGSNYDAWLVKLDAGGNVSWSKKYGDGNPYGSVLYDVIQLSDGGYALCGTNPFTSGLAESYVIKTDVSGNVLWARTYGMNNSDDATGLLEDGNSLLVTGFYYGMSYYEGYLMKLDKANGDLQWVKGYDGENRSTWFSKISKVNNGYQVYSVITDNFVDQNQQECIWNLGTDGTVQSVKKLVVPGIRTNSVGWCPLADGGFMATNGQSNSSSDALLCRVNSSGVMDWSKKFGGTGVQIINAIVPAGNGGYILSGVNNSNGTVTDSNNVFLISVDTVGGSCSGTNTSDLTVVSPSYTTPASTVTTRNVLSIGNPVVTVNVVDLPLAVNQICSNCELPPPPPPPLDTTCSNGQPLFMKEFKIAGEQTIYAVAALADGGTVSAGFTRFGGNGGYDGWLVKTDRKGSVIWSKAIGGTGDDYFYQVRATSDGGVIVAGQTKSYGNTAGDAWLVKVGLNGNVEWSKKYGDGNANGETASDAIQLSDGGYALCGSHRFAPGTAESFVVRTDASGNVLWAKQYGNWNSDNATGLLEDGSNLYVTGFYYGSSYYEGYLMKLDAGNGDMLFIKGYDTENRSTWFTRLTKIGSNLQVNSIITDNFGDQNQQECVWTIDLNGSVQTVRKLVIPGIQTNSRGWYPLDDGGFIATNGINNGSADVLMCRVKPDGTLGWAKKYPATGNQAIHAIDKTSGGDYIGAGITNNSGTFADSNNFYLIRVDSTGVSCGGENTNDISIVNPSYTTPSSDVALIGNVIINNPVITVGVVDLAMIENIICFSCRANGTGYRVADRATGEEGHKVKVYPNPVIGQTIKLEVDAKANDAAVITIVDLQGNTVYLSNSKEILKGINTVSLNTRLQPYTNYFIHVRFRTTVTSLKVFVITQ